MRLEIFIVAIFLLAACAPSQSSRPSEAKTPPTLAQDAADCERKAALAGVGGRAKVFDECMRAAGRAPAR